MAYALTDAAVVFFYLYLGEQLGFDCELDGGTVAASGVDYCSFFCVYWKRLSKCWWDEIKACFIAVLAVPISALIPIATPSMQIVVQGQLTP